MTTTPATDDTLPPPRSAPRVPGLDTLRALAILAVIPSHARDYLHWPVVKAIGRHGWSGVDLFFVLSGYLIAGQLVAEARRDGRVSFARFYAKRAFRILPAYLVVLALYYAWPGFTEQPKVDPPWRFLLFIMNLGARPDAFSHAWSLCVEEHFYLVLPALLAVLLPRATARRVGALFAFVLVGGLALRLGLQASGVHFWRTIYRPTWCRLDGLTVGVALATLQAARPQVWTRLQRLAWPLAAAGTGVVALGLWAMQAGGAYAAGLSFPAVALGFGTWIVVATAPGSWLAQRRIPGAATVATLAYALYLTHKQMLHLAIQIVGDADAAPAWTLTVAIALILGFATLLHVAVERPFLRLRDRVLGPHRAASAALSAPSTPRVASDLAKSVAESVSAS